MSGFDRFLVPPEPAAKAESTGTFEIRKKACFCIGCPTYNSCAAGKTERVFCLSGPSTCIKERDISRCICSTCPVQEELGFFGEYCCNYGTAVEHKL